MSYFLPSFFPYFSFSTSVYYHYLIKYYYYYLFYLSLTNYLLYRVLYRKNTVSFWSHILSPSDWLAGDYQSCTWISSPSDSVQFLGLEEAAIAQRPSRVGGNSRGLAIKSSAPGPAPARGPLHMIGWGQPYKWSAHTLPFPKLILSRPGSTSHLFSAQITTPMSHLQRKPSQITWNTTPSATLWAHNILVFLLALSNHSSPYFHTFPFSLLPGPQFYGTRGFTSLVHCYLVRTNNTVCTANLQPYLVDGVRRGWNVIGAVGFQTLSLVTAVELGLPQKVRGLWVRKWVSIKADGPGLCKGLMTGRGPWLRHVSLDPRNWI